ncbi:MAG TPA: FAD-dependent monooxygenase [Gemmatimonadales bacterium]|nr:FAD-dependent monooxygenase [Gemmatimonadales bacterium]
MPKFDRAVVMGGSMAGLLAARALADHATEVFLLERDALPEEPCHRKGVPQSKHTHVLLGSGRRTLEQFFPGLTSDLTARGAVQGDPMREVLRYLGGGCHCRSTSDLRTLYVSRPMLESYVRSRVRGLPNVTLLERRDIRGLTMSDDGSRVTGVAVEQDGTASTIVADVVVDATGRGSRSPQWLAQAGFPAPDEEVVECHASYATRQYRLEPGQLDGIKSVLVAPSPGSLRGAVLAQQEDSRWILTLIGLMSHRPPTDDAGFRAYAKALPSKEIAELVETATPIDDAIPASYPSNTRRRYDRMTRFPERYVILGDAICSFNPMYGQGMSVAALEGAALADTLAEPGSEGLGPRFFRKAAPALEAPWLLAAGNDLRLTKPDAPVSRGTKIVRWYMDRLHVAARTDPAVAQAFLLVTGLVMPPSSLFKPAVALRVLGARH